MGVLRFWPATVFLYCACCAALVAAQVAVREFAVPDGSHPHDVAPTPDGGVWYTAQRSGALGWLDPQTGTTRHIDLGHGSSPHGVIVGPDGAPWITDSGLNAIVRVDPVSSEVRIFAPPAGTPNMNLNTAAFDQRGVLWFTGQAGYYGRLDPATARIEVFAAPHGRGPYGICAAPDGSIYYASLAGSHIARIDPDTAVATVIEPPTPRQGARRVWRRLFQSHLGQRVADRTGQCLRSANCRVAHMEAAGVQAAGVRGLRRWQRHRLAVGFRQQRHRALRSGQ